MTNIIVINDLPNTKGIYKSDFDYDLRITKDRIKSYFASEMKPSDIICFDNDLGIDEFEGYQLLRDNISNSNFPKIVVIISRNPPAILNMKNTLESNGYKFVSMISNEFLMYKK